VKYNKAIGCSVRECRFHSKNEPMCSLENIQVAKSTSSCSSESDTKCASFEKE